MTFRPDAESFPDGRAKPRQPMDELDFLGLRDEEVETEEEFFECAEEDSAATLFALVNTIERDEFVRVLSDGFDIEWRGDNALIATIGADNQVAVWLDEQFPLLVSSGPVGTVRDTLAEIDAGTPDIGRLIFSMTQLDTFLQRTRSYDSEAVVTAFTARNAGSVTGVKRSDRNRTMSYWANDGLETYLDLRERYGVLPSSFRVATNDFEATLREDGSFTVHDGSVQAAAREFTSIVTDRCQPVEVIEGSGPKTVESQFRDRGMEVVVPWQVDTDGGFDASGLNQLEERRDRWAYGISRVRGSGASFDAELIDDRRYSRTKMRTKGSLIRVFPHDELDVAGQLRLLAFLEDHFDRECKVERVE